MIRRYWRQWAVKLRRFFTAEDGTSSVEMAVILALVIVVVIIAVQTLGSTANSVFQSVGSAAAPPVIQN